MTIWKWIVPNLKTVIEKYLDELIKLADCSYDVQFLHLLLSTNMFLSSISLPIQVNAHIVTYTMDSLLIIFQLFSDTIVTVSPPQPPPPKKKGMHICLPGSVAVSLADRWVLMNALASRQHRRALIAVQSRPRAPGSSLKERMSPGNSSISWMNNWEFPNGKVSENIRFSIWETLNFSTNW